MKSMRFLPELKAFLSQQGVIYTVRGFKMTRAEVHVEGVGVCSRVLIDRVVGQEGLIPYVSQSGFDSLETWVKKIAQFIPEGGDAWLYEVVSLEREAGEE